MEKTFSKNAQKIARLYDFSKIIQSGTKAEIISALDEIIGESAFQSKGWKSNFQKLRQSIISGNPAFSVFKLDGNSKLPFVAFSTLPGVTCPGAGSCLDFCYSFRAWRYPAAFMRQAQNAFLMRFFPDTISREFSEIAQSRPEGFDFRLYVDGDFSSVSDVDFWMFLLNIFPHVRAYGYSKSFQALLQYWGNWPKNYQLNVSSGHNSSPEIVEQIKGLPITRGEFVAVSIGRKVKSSDHGTAENNRAIREAFAGTKVFPCPGKCGTCTKSGHACGMPKLKGVTIAIAMH